MHHNSHIFEKKIITEVTANFKRKNCKKLISTNFLREKYIHFFYKQLSY